MEENYNKKMLILNSREDDSRIVINETVTLPINREQYIKCSIYCSFDNETIIENQEDMLPIILKEYPGETIFCGHNFYYVNEEEFRIFVHDNRVINLFC